MSKQHLCQKYQNWMRYDKVITSCIWGNRVAQCNIYAMRLIPRLFWNLFLLLLLFTTDNYINIKLKKLTEYANCSRVCISSELVIISSQCHGRGKSSTESRHSGSSTLSMTQTHLFTTLHCTGIS